jgi:hypothetical protein
MLHEFVDQGRARLGPGVDRPVTAAVRRVERLKRPQLRGPAARAECEASGRQQRLYFNPLPHGHAELRESRSTARKVRPRTDETRLSPTHHDAPASTLARSRAALLRVAQPGSASRGARAVRAVALERSSSLSSRANSSSALSVAGRAEGQRARRAIPSNEPRLGKQSSARSRFPKPGAPMLRPAAFEDPELR